ncbi:MAG: aldo/keto reductase [Sneathiella sp.]
MSKIKLGRTQLQVSKAGLGCGGHSRLGQGYGESHAHSVNVVRAAMDLGVNFIDTAKVYGTETIVGDAVTGRRDQIVLSSKGQIIKPDSPPLGDDFISADDLEKSLDDSLKNLKTDYLDVYHLHGIMPHQYDICIDRFLPVLKDAQKAGKIRFIGITERFIHDPSHEMLQKALSDNYWDVVMVGFNMVNPSARKTVFPLTQENDVGVLNMFAVRNALGNPQNMLSLLQRLAEEGHLSMEEAARRELVDELIEATFSGSLTEAAYRFCVFEQGNQVVLTGTGKIDHLRRNVDAISKPALDQNLLDRLETAFGHINTVSGE